MIKYLVFDIGSILIYLHADRSSAAYEKLGIEKDFVDKLSTDRNFLYFEEGRITDDEFYQYCLSHSKKDFSFSDFRSAWCSFLGDEVKGVNTLLTRIRDRYRIFTLSNTNSLHWESIKNYQVFKNFDGHFLSYKLGVRKPNENIYKELISTINAPAKHVLYIDDLIENVRIARETGVCAEVANESVSQIKYILQKYQVT